MLDLRARAVRQRDKLCWVFFQTLLALCAVSTVFGLGDGPRWVTAVSGVVLVLLGRLILRLNIRFGTRWRRQLHGDGDSR